MDKKSLPKINKNVIKRRLKTDYDRKNNCINSMYNFNFIITKIEKHRKNKI